MHARPLLGSARLAPLDPPAFSAARLGAQAPGEDRLLHMQAIFGLVPYCGLRPINYLCGYLIAAMSWQAMHKDRVLCRKSHQCAINLERPQQLVPLVLVAVAHRYPDIGHQAVCTLARFARTIADFAC